MICISCSEDSQVEIPKRIHVKMFNNEEIVSFPHYLVLNHCNADVYIIIHVPSDKIWNHLGQFGGLDIKTS